MSFPLAVTHDRDELLTNGFVPPCSPKSAFFQSTYDSALRFITCAASSPPSSKRSRLAYELVYPFASPPGVVDSEVILVPGCFSEHGGSRPLQAPI